MAFRLITKPIAYIDLEEAIKWYEKSRWGLVEDFSQKLAKRKLKFPNGQHLFHISNIPLEGASSKNFLIGYYM